MTGGFLVVLDRSGKDLKKYEAKAGLVTLGSDLSCDIRILVATVKPHHATVTVRGKQTVIRDLSEGNTYVNEAPVSVHALNHGDIITVGDRSFRWEYSQPQVVKKIVPQPVVPLLNVKRGKRGRPARARMSEGVSRKLDPEVHLALELNHRASMPGSTKQVAIVQPRRRDFIEMSESKRTVTRPRLNVSVQKRTPRKAQLDNSNITKSNGKLSQSMSKKSPRGRTSREIPPDAETKASQWIESRKSSPKTPIESPNRTNIENGTPKVTRKSVKYVHTATPRPKTPYVEKSPSKMMASKTPRRVLATKKITPLRTAVLRKAITPKLTPKTTPRNRVEKIEDPLVMDKNKKAALMLITRTPQSRNSTPKAIRQSSQIVVLKKPNTPINVSGRKSRKTKSTSPKNVTATLSNASIGALTITDDESDCMMVDNASQIEDSIQNTSVSTTQSPRKSALKQPNSSRSHDRSIKFDLDNLESSNDSSVLIVSGTSNGSNDSTLHLPDTSCNTRNSSRSSRILERSLGKCPVYVGQSSMDTSASFALAPSPPQSPSRSSRTSLIMKNSLNESSSNEKSIDSSPSRRRNTSRVSTRSPKTVQVDGLSTPVLGMVELMSDQYNSTQSDSSEIGASVENTPVIQIGKMLASGSGRRRATGSINASTSQRRTSRQIAKRSLTSTPTDENATTPPNEENVTPKSSVKLIPEAVKQKHSTAKKPVSKRTLIDNLDESAIIKDLFSSPVKRKLSRSMVEFNKTSSDEERATNKRTRRTIAANEVTPNQSINECDTPQVSTSLFISPLDNTTKSPNLEGVKRLFGKNTPQNNLNNVKGVKGIFKTPRAKKSIVNDLNNVSGVRNMFRRGRTPKDDLSNVEGVKEVFTRSPRNDLRRVSGVKTLFQQQKKNQSPKNKSDFNVSGVKRLMTQRSPKNDLRDVRGVKRMFRTATEQPQESLNLSGIEELFDEPSTAENLFDKMVGRRQPRMTYSKSAVLAKADKKKSAGSKSLTFNVSSNNSWLKTAKAPIASKAKNVSFKPNKSTELNRLLTSTVAGEVPLLTSRVRANGSGRNSLPLKKRSINSSGNVTKTLLPIKKRVIVHSTPVKANRSTIVPTEMGKVSPIASAEKTSVLEVTMSPKPKQQAKTKQQTPKIRVTKSKTVAPLPLVEPVLVQISPRKTRTTKIIKVSPVKRKTKTSEKRASLVITKKTPVFKGAKRQKDAKNAPEISATFTEVKVITPKPARRTRAKVTPNSAIVKRVSTTPKLVVKRARVVSFVEKPKRGRKPETPKVESVVKRKRKTVAEEAPAKPKRGRVSAKKSVTTTNDDVETTNDKVTNVAATKTRGRKAKEVPKEIEVPNTKVVGRRRGKKEDALLVEKEEKPVINKSTAKGKAKKVVEVVEPVEEKKRGRHAKKDTAPEPVVEEKPQRGRKRKADGSPVKETTKRQTRTRNTTDKSKSPAKKAKTQATKSKSPVKKTKTQVTKSKSPVKKTKSQATKTKSQAQKTKEPAAKTKPQSKKVKSPVKKTKTVAKPNSPTKTKTTRAKAAKTQTEGRGVRRRN